MSPTTDKLNRPLHDVRISIIDRCNFRCTYCMPQDSVEQSAFLSKKQWLTFEEIVRLAKIFVSLGAQKMRITGGEPLLRPGVPDLIAELTEIPGIMDTALTTNGVLLSQYAKQLHLAGLSRLTVSLDALDARVFQQMGGTRSELRTVLDGIRSAEQAGFTAIKINVVVQKGVNDGQIMDLAEYFRGTGHVVRFIEYMDVGNCNHWDRRYVVPSQEILTHINHKYPLRPVTSNYYGEVAERYAYADGGGEIGFISSVSQPFCQSCTRLRLTADGRLVTCLFAHKGTDIRDLMRSGASDEALRTAIRNIWEGRQDQYSQQRPTQKSCQQGQKKLEMFQVGG